MSAFDQLVSTLADLQTAVTSDTSFYKAFQSPPRSISLAPQIASLGRLKGEFAAMIKALESPKLTRQQVRARVREGVADVMVKALAAQKEGTVSGLEVVRLEAEALHLMAAI